ncbi:MAG: biotin--[acetyl-CoA-carboxylase] ligase [Thermoprotei archaeon]|nr:MAG: biotin--[acetyl-CoA-carboxylase] ligase [Thermoprotei archaeon]
MMRVKSGECVSEGSSLTHSLIDFLYIRKTRSTMIVAKDILKKCKKLVIIAGHQTRGVGRRGRTWSSPPGGLWFSLVLKLHIPAHVVPFLSLAMALSVAEALRSKGLNAWIKWPNDVVVDGKKICGVLADVKISHENIAYTILGVGINTNFYLRNLPTELQNTAVTVFEILGFKLDNIELLDEVMHRFEKYIAYLKNEFVHVIRKEMEKILYGKDEEVVAICEKGVFKGILKGIGLSGSLLLETKDGIKEIESSSLKKLLVKTLHSF